MRVYEIQAGSTNVAGLLQAERPVPVPSAKQVLVRVRAASLNGRDLGIMGGHLQGPVRRNLIPLSDGAGVVTEVGAEVQRFKPGDRVAATFFQTWIDGPPDASRVALGNPMDGMLAEYVCLHEDGLVAIPENLSFEEAATLPCAAVTAWNALFRTGRPVQAGDTVLCLGTGGVSMFALAFAKHVGAKVLMTSSSDEKIARARELGADESINYRQCAEWGKEALARTGGRGADHILEVGGSGTLRRSVQALAWGGKIALIGFLAGVGAGVDPLYLMTKNASAHGVSVGARRVFEEMNRILSEAKLRPVIDKLFPFDQAAEAYRYHASGQFVGKIVIAV